MPLILGAVASVYTAFKLIQPPRWHSRTAANIALFSADLSVSAFLVMLSGSIHSPFALFTLAPVLSAAILLERVYSFAIAGVTGAYMGAALALNARSHPGVIPVNEFAVYLAALSLTSILPYLMNDKDRQKMKLNAMLSERQRLAREIHDNLCQTIYALRWHVQMMGNGTAGNDRTIAQARLEKLAEQAEVDARSLISLLQTPSSDVSIKAALGAFLNEYEGQHSIQFDVDEDEQCNELDDTVRSEVLHICKEALRNSIKHSGCRQILVRITGSTDRFLATLADDGLGFDDTGRSDGWGLKIMKERAESVGGRLEVETRPGFGTEIRLEVPWKCPSDILAANQQAS